MLKNNTIIGGLIVLCIAFALVAYSSNLKIASVTDANEALTTQLDAIQAQMDEITSNKSNQEDAYQFAVDAILEAQASKNDALEVLLEKQAALIEASGIETSAYERIYSFDDMQVGHVYAYLDQMKDFYDLSNARELLTDVIQRMSVTQFDYLPISLVDLESNEHGYTAIIDLEELAQSAVASTEASDLQTTKEVSTWANTFFQGSSGGGTTEATLLYNVLQPDVKNWPIDSVTFTYQGEKIEYDHVPMLYDTVERSMVHKIGNLGSAAYDFK